jgi:hypothetical protein
MVTGKEIWDSARLLIERHGAEASTRAAAKAEQLAIKGNFEGQRTWVRIRTAIEWLQDTSRGGGSRAEH